MIDIYVDGSSIGNPGKCGIGYLIYQNNKLLKKEVFILEYKQIILPNIWH